jgi:hypothetical protein
VNDKSNHKQKNVTIRSDKSYKKPELMNHNQNRHEPQKQNSHDAVNQKSEIKSKCIECRKGICKPFKVEDIKAILASNRSNGALYYKIKFNNNSTEWHYDCKVPNQLIREFHAN